MYMLQQHRPVAQHVDSKYKWSVMISTFIAAMYLNVL